MNILCQYCSKQAEFVSNAEVYGKPYGKSHMIYLCRKCDAYVGVHHNDPERPFGQLANKDVRDARKRAHRAVDPYWKSGELSRRQVYTILSKAFGEDTHIGSADVELCERITDLAQDEKKFTSYLK